MSRSLSRASPTFRARSAVIHQSWFSLSVFQADVGNRFCLADTSLNRAGAWKGCTLNSRFFRPVVSIPHAFPGAKHSSCSCLLSHLTGTMWCCTCPHFADPSCLRLYFYFFFTAETLWRLYNNCWFLLSVLFLSDTSSMQSFHTEMRRQTSSQEQFTHFKHLWSSADY